MSVHKEIQFESTICEYLAATGWLYSENDAGYDRERALFPEDVREWFQDSQPAAYKKFVKPDAPDADKRWNMLLDRLAASLSKPMTDHGGALNTLRKGFSVAGYGVGSAKFDMMQAKPETDLNPHTMARYEANRLRVMRQVHYGDGNKSIDLVFFINGVPVATAEIKTENTQPVENAKQQYRDRKLTGKDRTPFALLGNGTRALVHFALSEDEVWMTTKLAGERTFFLPFNQGTEDGGAGNPLNPEGHKTAYLWQQVLQRDAWLGILTRFIWIKESRETGDDGRQKRNYTMIFPRYHQWDVVQKLERAVRVPDPKRRFLIQHSAGSGKTNSIAWTAHRLARLQVNNKKLFDSVIVVTDRNVLDAQLQEAIRQIDEDSQSIVATIDDKAIREAAQEAVLEAADGSQKTGASKSSALARALTKGKLIIVVTIQTFPFILDKLENEDELQGKSFAVLADEAHSSQSGRTAAQLKSVLSVEQLAELDEDGEIEVDAEQMMAERVARAELDARVHHRGVSFFAFTATPKKKTLEIFGHRETPQSDPKPFHLYSMKQAIEEGFILDVLRGYRTYKMYFDLGEKAAGALDVEVEESDAKATVMQWVRVHPTTISQKAAIIVEHFQHNVAGLLDGTAKAMVVAPNRLGAVRYKREIDRYIKSNGLSYKTLVAFSGTVEDTETSAELGLETLTESTMNHGVRDIRQEFKGDQYRVMIVANKFQTGFDQPLLCAMYVDKRLSGLTAVQTLSRLNRTHTTARGHKKTAAMTQVLDFVNDPAEIRSAFEPYYADAHIDEQTDPHQIWDLLSSIDMAEIYTADEVAALYNAFLGAGNITDAQISAAITRSVDPAADRFARRLRAARHDEAQIDVKILEQFKKDVASFVKFYEFMTQVIDYQDADLVKKATFLRFLAPRLRDEGLRERIDMSDVELVRIELVDEGATTIDITGGGEITGTSAVGTAEPRDPKMVALLEVIRELSALTGDTEEATRGAVATIFAKLEEDDMLVKQAQSNSESQFQESPDLQAGTNKAVLGAGDAMGRVSDVLFREDSNSTRVRRLLAQAFYRSQNDDK